MRQFFQGLGLFVPRLGGIQRGGNTAQPCPLSKFRGVFTEKYGTCVGLVLCIITSTELNEETGTAEGTILINRGTR